MGVPSGPPAFAREASEGCRARSPKGEGGPPSASYGSASHPAIVIGKDSGKADALTPDQNIENNPMQSSMVVAGMDALSDPAKTF